MSFKIMISIMVFLQVFEEKASGEGPTMPTEICSGRSRLGRKRLVFRGDLFRIQKKRGKVQIKKKLQTDPDKLIENLSYTHFEQLFFH